MIQKDLLNQKINFNGGVSEIVKVFNGEKEITFNNINDLMVSLDSNKKVNLFVGFSSGKITFIDNNIQSKLKKIIDEYNRVEKEKKVNAQHIQDEIIKKRKREILLENRHKENKSNISIKVTFNQNDEGDIYHGLCSRECMINNCKKNPFCSSKLSLCKKYLNGEVTLEQLQQYYKEGKTCYESKMFDTFTVKAGRDVKTNEPRNWNVKKDRIVVLSTVEPGHKELDRIIVGLFYVDETFEKLDDNEAYAKGHIGVKFNLSDARNLKYWDIVPGEGKSQDKLQWKEGLVRYLSDDTISKLFDYLIKYFNGNEDKINKLSELKKLYIQAGGYTL